MDSAELSGNNLGPIEVLYNGADMLLRMTEQAIPQRALSDFFESVHWSERFIVTLLASQFAVFSIAMISRRNFVAQAVVFLAISVTVFCSESLNALGKKNWHLIASQDYFDRQGLFMLIFVSGPLIITANVIVVCLNSCNSCCPSLWVEESCYCKSNISRST